MANPNVNPGGIPHQLLISIPAHPTAKPGNATYVFGSWIVPTRPRPDGAAAAAGTGGSANMRLIIDKISCIGGGNSDGLVGTTASTFTSINVINTSNSNAVLGTLALLTTAQVAANQNLAMTLITTSTTRNSVSVPDRILLAGDILNATGIGTHANDRLPAGSAFILECHWEDQSTPTAQGF